MPPSLDRFVMTITTDASGVATTGENALPYGEYTVREVSTNDSMLKTFDEEISVTIDSDGVMLEYEAENEVVRGGIDLEKQDSQTGSTPQGNASFAGIEFEIINRSANPVVVGGQTYAVGEVVMTVTTNESGIASTGSDVLPYGTYEVRESATNESMLLTWTGETVTVRHAGPCCFRHGCGRGGAWRPQRGEAGHYHRFHSPGGC